MNTALLSGITTYPFPKGIVTPSFQFSIRPICEGADYYKAPPHPHAHSYFEIFLIEKGGGFHMIDNVRYPFKDRSVHIMQPRVPHYIQRDENTRCQVIVFDQDVIAGENNIIHDCLTCFFNNRLMQPVATVSARAFKELMTIVRLMKSDSIRQVPTQEQNAYIRTLFSAFLLTLKPHFTSNFQLSDSNTLSLVNRYISLVNKHYHEGLSNAGYALRLGVSEKTMIRAVKKHTLLTPSKIVRERIILEASRLLHNTSYSIKEIAYHLHFSDPAHFVHVFRQEKNCTPSEYRKASSK